MFRFSRDIRYPSLNYRADLQELKSGELILYRAVKMFRFSRDIRYPSLNYRADLQELKSGELILQYTEQLKCSDSPGTFAILR